MKVYPIIYSRTKYCDYVPGFLVRPGDFDWELALQYVGRALEGLKLAGGIRYAAFSVGEYAVYGGIACVTSEMIKKILLEKGIDELDYDYKDYQRDKAGRQNTFFVGFGVRKCEAANGEVPDISLYDTYKVYLKLLKKQWLAPYTETQLIAADEGIEVGSSRYKDEFQPETIGYKGKRLVKNFNGEDYRPTINYYFHQLCLGRECEGSFLSDVQMSDVGDDNCFENISIYDIMSFEEYPADNRDSGWQETETSQMEGIAVGESCLPDRNNGAGGTAELKQGLNGYGEEKVKKESRKQKKQVKWLKKLFVSDGKNGLKD